jgi:anionic cell wall polymer biosynthesis LytR-Cps2A-Psr (LCP) family protein
MTLKRGIAIGVLVLVIGGTLFVFLKIRKEWKTANAVTTEEVVKKTEERREAATSTSVLEKGEITVLLLGLDSRQGQASARCDAIHLFTLNTNEKRVKITSIPRGTYVYIPPGTYSQSESYFSNACELAGYDYVKGEVEKMLSTHVDYVVKVGFSQTLGVLRTLKLPTTQSLQWLRNRQSFLIGDPQRSHDQAVFMRDVVLKKLDTFKNPAWFPIAKVVYSYVDTDLDFDSAYALLKLYADSDLENHPERIELVMNPPYKVKDLHFDFENPESFLEKFPKLTPDATSTIMVTTALEDGTEVVAEEVTTTPVTKQTLADVQRQIIANITYRLSKHLSLDDIVHKRLWLQVENEETREDLHFKIVSRLVEGAPGREKKIDLITAYIQEKDVFELPEWAEKGKELMRAVVDLPASSIAREEIIFIGRDVLHASVPSK